MMRFIFTKSVTDKSTGHLYEHIFCDYLTHSLREKGFFAYVDYSLNAKSYHVGSILLTIDCYNSTLEKLLININKIHPKFNYDSINGSLLQIMAEYTSDISSIEDDLVLNHLKVYDRKSWISLAHEPKSFPVTVEGKDAIQYSSQNKSSFGEIIQTISINTNSFSLKSEHLLPLVVIVTKAIRSNLQEDISRSSFCFSREDTFTRTQDYFEDINIYSIDKRQTESITDEPELAKNLLTRIRKSEFTKRLVTSLATPTSGDDIPNEEEIKVKTGYGNINWRAVATEKAVDEIIASLNVSFSFRASSED